MVSGNGVEVGVGEEALVALASDPEADLVVNALVGTAGLPVTAAAVSAGKRLAIANKESLVMSGELFMQTVREQAAELLPIDSEHNAVFQCLPADFARGLAPVGVRRILLTASGGPFRPGNRSQFTFHIEEEWSYLPYAQKFERLFSGAYL